MWGPKGPKAPPKGMQNVEVRSFLEYGDREWKGNENYHVFKGSAKV